MKISTVKEDIVNYARLLYDQGYVVGSEGNISVRISKNRILITPTGVIKKLLEPENISEIDRNGVHRRGNLSPSSEYASHLEIYKKRPDIKAIIHAHPVYATLLSVLNIDPFSKIFLSEAVMFLRDVKFAPFACPSTDEGAKVIRALGVQSNIIIMNHHGTFTYGKDLSTAFSLLEILEKYCKMYYLALLSKKEINFLSDQQMNKLLKVKYG